MFKFNLRLLTSILLIILVSAIVVYGEVPNKINYQGYLTDDSGEPVSNDNYDIIFTIYDDPLIGANLWSSGIISVPVSNGYFNVELGPIPDSVFKAGPDRYLGIQVETDPELSPRSHLVSVPYTLKAGKADSLEVPNNFYGVESIPILTVTNDGTGHAIEAFSQSVSAIEAKNITGEIDNTRAYLGGQSSAVVGEFLHPGSSTYGALGTIDYGVYGIAETLNGISIYGINEVNFNIGYLGSSNYGVYGQGGLGNSYAGYFDGKSYFSSNVGIGIDPVSVARLIVDAQNGHAIDAYGHSGSSAIEANNSVGATDYTRAYLAGDYNAVFGEFLIPGEDNYGSLGSPDHGVYGLGQDVDDIAIYGMHDGSQNYGYLGSDSAGVFGHAGTTNDYAGYFDGRSYFTDNVEAVYSSGGIDRTRGYMAGDWFAVYGEYLSTGTGNYGGLGSPDNGVYGYGSEVDDIAVYGKHDSENYGYLGSDSVGVLGYAETSNDYAGYFDGKGYFASNLGIGTSNPTSLLHLEGNNPEITLNTTNYLDGINFMHNGANRWSLAWNSGNGYIYFYNYTGGGTSLTLEDGTGYVGIKTGTPSYELDVNGDIECTQLHQTSDMRFKTDIKSIPNALDKINQLEGVSFKWNQETYPDQNFSQQEQLGFIAQDVKEIIPELVSQNKEGYFSVEYGKITPVLLEAIKEQQKQINALKDEIEKLKASK